MQPSEMRMPIPFTAKNAAVSRLTPVRSRCRNVQYRLAM